MVPHFYIFLDFLIFHILPSSTFFHFPRFPVDPCSRFPIVDPPPPARQGFVGPSPFSPILPFPKLPLSLFFRGGGGGGVGHTQGKLVVFCFKSDGPLRAESMLLFHISSVAGTRWPKGLAYNNGGLDSTSSPMSWWL